jgi:hypothetical protein
MKYLVALGLVFGTAGMVACGSTDEQAEIEVVQEVADAETATLNVTLM